MAFVTRPRTSGPGVDRSRENLAHGFASISSSLHCLPDQHLLPPGKTFAALDDVVGRGARSRANGVSCRAGRGRPQGHRIPGRCLGPDHLQHAPASARPTTSWPKRSVRDVGVFLARVPLASGLLTGKDEQTDRLRRLRSSFLQPSWRGPSTWARPSPGVDYETGSGLSSKELPRHGPGPAPRWAQMALRWILMFDGG